MSAAQRETNSSLERDGRGSRRTTRGCAAMLVRTQIELERPGLRRLRVRPDAGDLQQSQRIHFRRQTDRHGPVRPDVNAMRRSDDRLQRRQRVEGVAISLAGPYVTFFELGQGLLKMLADIHQVSVKPPDVEELYHRFATMPAHPDVERGLTQLKAAGFRLVAFTNSPPVHPSPAENAGLGNFFEREFSIDRVRQFKPAPQCYHVVAEELDVELSECGMVAAHVWDTLGAQCAGYSGAALITRGVNAPLLVHRIPQPQIVPSDFMGLAAQAAKLWRR